MVLDITPNTKFVYSLRRVFIYSSNNYESLLGRGLGDNLEVII